MKEFIVLDKNNIVLDRATVRWNLWRAEEPDTRLIEFEGDFLIGDRIENGKVIHSDDPFSERQMIHIKKENKHRAIQEIKQKLGLNDQEFDKLREALR